MTVTANPQTKTYGSADPALTDTLTGLVDTAVDGVTIVDTAATVLTGTLARTAGEAVAGSPYAITQGTLAAGSNYTIHFTTSTLSITPATPTVSVHVPGGAYTGADRGPGHRDRGQRPGGGEPGGHHADLDVLRRIGHVGHGPGRNGAFGRRDVYGGGQLPRQRRLCPGPVEARDLRDRTRRRRRSH